MASLLSPRRTTAGLSLQATDAGPRAPETAPETGNGPPVGWPVAAIAGGLVTALVGWVLCAGLAVVGWLAADLPAPGAGLVTAAVVLPFHLGLVLPTLTAATARTV